MTNELNKMITQGIDTQFAHTQTKLPDKVGILFIPHSRRRSSPSTNRRAPCASGETPMGSTRNRTNSMIFVLSEVKWSLTGVLSAGA